MMKSRHSLSTQVGTSMRGKRVQKRSRCSHSCIRQSTRKSLSCPIRLGMRVKLSRWMLSSLQAASSSQTRQGTVLWANPHQFRTREILSAPSRGTTLWLRVRKRLKMGRHSGSKGSCRASQSPYTHTSSPVSSQTSTCSISPITCRSHPTQPQSSLKSPKAIVQPYQRTSSCAN